MAQWIPAFAGKTVGAIRVILAKAGIHSAIANVFQTE
jgi:hypothetical protein